MIEQGRQRALELGLKNVHFVCADFSPLKNHHPGARRSSGAPSVRRSCFRARGGPPTGPWCCAEVRRQFSGYAVHPASQLLVPTAPTNRAEVSKTSSAGDTATFPVVSVGQPAWIRPLHSFQGTCAIHSRSCQGVPAYSEPFHQDVLGPESNGGCVHAFPSVFRASALYVGLRYVIAEFPRGNGPRAEAFQPPASGDAAMGGRRTLCCTGGIRSLARAGGEVLSCPRP